jgi:putative transposase
MIYSAIYRGNCPKTITAIKSVKQLYQPTPAMLHMMETFKQMVNDCIKIGLENDISTLKALSKLCLPQLAKYRIISYYKLHAISKAAGILANRKQSLKRGYQTRTPYLKRAIIISSYGFRITDGALQVPLGEKQYFDIPLNSYVRKVLSDSLKIRSFTLTVESVSICYSKEVAEVECTSIEGVDRNPRNLTVGNGQNALQYDLSKAIDIAESTRSIIKGFKRNDVRIKKMLYGKYGKRRKNRINQLLHHVSKAVVQRAKESKTAIVFEDIRRIRRLYQRGNHQGRAYRGRMNSWSFAEIKHQTRYKAAWEGIPIIELSSDQTRGTSQKCPQCGKRVQEAPTPTLSIDASYGVMNARNGWIVM